MDTLRLDLRFAWRSLRRNPGFTLIAVLALALGIGANTAIFSVVDAVLLRPLPFADPGDLVVVSDGASQPHLEDWTAQTRSWRALGAHASGSATLGGADAPERVEISYVSDGMLALLGVPAALGRVFEAGESGPGAAAVLILSHDLWQRRFAGDPEILGRSVQIEGEPFTVIGVMPRGFQFPLSAEAGQLWMPLGTSQLHKSNIENRGAHLFEVIGRLAPGVALPAAARELEALAQRLKTEHPETDDLELILQPLQEHLVGDARLPLLLLTGAVAFVLLIACANVANLLLARTMARNRELTVRAALGASRGRLIRQLLTESALLGGAAAVVGILLCAWTLELLGAALPESIRQLGEVRLNAPVLGFTLAVTALTTVGFGLLPAWLASRSELHDALKAAGGKTAGGRGHVRVRGALVVGEIAIAVVLLVGAALLSMSFYRVMQEAPGFDPENLYVADISLPEKQYPEGPAQRRLQTALLERIRARPGIEAAALALPMPMTGSNIGLGLAIENYESPERLTVAYRAVTPGYFAGMKIPLRQGRAFSDTDGEKSEAVVIVNDAFVKRYWPNEDPIGKRLTIGYGPPQLRTVVGVVGNVRHTSRAAEERPEVYAPLAQTPWPFFSLAVRSPLPQASLAAMLREEVAALDRALALPELEAMEDLMAKTVAARRFTLILLAAFGAVALILAATGIYGVIAYSVSQRTREVGIRMALGATTGSVTRLVVREGMLFAAIGVGIGLALAAVLTRFVSSLLYQTKAIDPLTYAALAGLIALVAFCACWLPARRAAKVDPALSLRAD